MFQRFDEKARRVIFFSRYEASNYGSPAIETEHLLLAIIREAPQILVGRPGFDFPNLVKQTMELAKARGEGRTISTSVDLPLSNECQRILGHAVEEADLAKSKPISAIHLLGGLLREKQSASAVLLAEHGFTIDSVRKDYVEISSLPASLGAHATRVPGPSLVFVNESGLVLSNALNFGVVPRIGERVTLDEDGRKASFTVADVRYEHAEIDTETESHRHRLAQIMVVLHADEKA
jgi:ATP-dependent Clp protease ATP-binding subunit ClpC